MTVGLTLLVAAWLTLLAGSLANKIPEYRDYHHYPHYDHYDEKNSDQEHHRILTDHQGISTDQGISSDHQGISTDHHYSGTGESYKISAAKINQKSTSEHKISSQEGHEEEDYYDFSGRSYDQVHDFEEHEDYSGEDEDEDEQPISDVHPQDASPKHLVEGIGDDTPAVSFSAENNFRGPEIFFDGHALSLPRAVRSRSHRLKGGFNWTVYPKGNYSGTPTCLMADAGHPSTSGHLELIVGSVRRGCWCNDTVTVTPKPRTRVPGVQFWSERNGEGNSAYTDGRETRFPYAVEMRSFQLVGTWIPWTLFAESNFTGESNCLVAAPASPKGGVNYYFTNIPKQLRIGSVQQGCVASTSFEFAGIDEETMKKDKAAKAGAGGKNPKEDGGTKMNTDNDDGTEEEMTRGEVGFDSDAVDIFDNGENGKAESDAKKGSGAPAALKISFHIFSIGLFLVFAVEQ